MKRSNTNLAQACALTIFGFSSLAQAGASGLSEVYQMAVMHDAQIAQQRAQYQATKESVKVVKAGLLPQIQADGSYFVTDSDLPSDAGDVTSRDLSVTLNQPLFNKQVWSRFEQAQYLVEQAKSSLQSAEQDLIIRVADAYFKVLLAQEDVALSKTKEKSDKLQWDRAQASAEVGLGSRSDVLQAKSSFDLTKSQRISAENNLDVAFEELMKLTGKSLTELQTLASTAKLPSETFNMSEWVERAEVQNLAVRQLEAQLKTAQEEVEVQKSGHWFTANLQAKISDTDYSGNSGAAYTDNTNTRIGVTVSVPLYSGGATSAQVSEARYNQTSAQQALRSSREQARLNARTQVRSVERGESLVAALREAVNSNSSFLEAAEEGYKVGLKSLLEVLTARSNLYDARRNLIEAMHAQVLNRLNLEATVGDLTADDLKTYDALLTAAKP